MDRHTALEILGIEDGVSATDVKVAFHTLALQYHPDRNPSNPEAAARFREIKLAYDLVSSSQATQEPSTGGTMGDLFRTHAAKGRERRDIRVAQAREESASWEGWAKRWDVHNPATVSSSCIIAKHPSRYTVADIENKIRLLYDNGLSMMNHHLTDEELQKIEGQEGTSLNDILGEDRPLATNHEVFARKLMYSRNIFHSWTTGFNIGDVIPLMGSLSHADTLENMVGVGSCVSAILSSEFSHGWKKNNSLFVTLFDALYKAVFPHYNSTDDQKEFAELARVAYSYCNVSYGKPEISGSDIALDTARIITHALNAGLDLKNTTEVLAIARQCLHGYVMGSNAMNSPIQDPKEDRLQGVWDTINLMKDRGYENEDVLHLFELAETTNSNYTIPIRFPSTRWLSAFLVEMSDIIPKEHLEPAKGFLTALREGVGGYTNPREKRREDQIKDAFAESFQTYREHPHLFTAAMVALDAIQRDPLGNHLIIKKGLYVPLELGAHAGRYICETACEQKDPDKFVAGLKEFLNGYRRSMFYTGRIHNSNIEVRVPTTQQCNAYSLLAKIQRDGIIMGQKEIHELVETYLSP
jgi:hypothetical protein